MNHKNNCRLCGKKGEYKCSKCGKVSYCSRECQFKDWINHKNNCINFSNKNNKNKNSPISLNKKINSNIKSDKSRNNNKNYLNIDENGKKKNKTKLSNLYPNNNRNKNNTLKNRNISSTATNDSGTTITETGLKESQLINEDKNIPTFDFITSLKEIIFMKKIDNEPCEEKEEEDSEQFEEYNKGFNKLENKKIILLYQLLKKNREYIIEKVLLYPGKPYYYEKLSFFRDKFIDIEKYIFNYIFLIKYLYNQKDPISLIKANQALNYLAKELLDYKNKGLLVYSINTILKKCLEVMRSNIAFQNENYCHEIIKKYLFLISCLIKLSKQLEISKLYYKLINHYGNVFDLALDIVSIMHSTEKKILKSNLEFNVGGIFVKNNMLNSGIKLYKEVINIQNNLETFSFVFGASFYNISILYYVMGNIKGCELYLNDIFENIYKYDDITVRNKKFIDDFNKFKCKLLLFSAEFNMEKENYSKALDNLKEVINKLEKTSQKERHRTQQTLVDKKYNNLFAKNIKEYTKQAKASNKNLYPKSNSIVSDMIVGISKEKILKSKTKKKKNEKLSIEYLYDIDFYDSVAEKIHFNERIKEIVNGLFDAILFIQNEKELKLKELDYYKKRLNEKIRKQNTDINLSSRRMKSSSVVYETDGTLIEFGAKNLIGRVKKNDDKDKYYSYSNDRAKNRSITMKIKNKNKDLKENNLKKKDGNEKNFADNYYNQNQLIESRFIPEKTSEKFLSYFKDELVKKIKIVNNEGDISDFKNFFILLANLSLRQVEILNNTQNTKMPPILFKNLPIFFSRQFKNTLNPAQRNIFEKLRVLSLIRCKVLSDSSKKISVDNINYNIFHANIRFNDLKLKQYSDITKKIREVLERGYQKRSSTKLDNIYELKSSQLEISQSQDSQEKLTNKINRNECVKKYISKKSKQMQKSDINSSNSSEEKGSYDEDNNYENIDFKYRDKFDLNKFCKDLIEETNNSYMLYSKEEIDNIILLIKSPIFIRMLNILELKDIKELDNDHPLMIELLKNEIKRIERIHIIENKEDNNSFSKSSENDCNIDIDEKDLVNTNFGIKHKYSVDFSSFRIFQNKLKEINDGKKNENKESSDLLDKFNEFNNKKNEENNFHNILRTSTNVSILNKSHLNN